jgi:nicotinate-nucleotide pyrophosphorylase (carboxylating)
MLMKCARPVNEKARWQTALFAHERPSWRVKDIVRLALAEDIGAGDVTSAAFSGRGMARGVIVAKAGGVLSGMDLVRQVFRTLSRRAQIRPLKHDGEVFAPGERLAEIQAPLQVLFSGERVALNFLQRMSGVATLTRRFVDLLGPHTTVAVCDTRKTTPLLRTLERKAVRDGGGVNHRFGLDDMAMLKNNHIDAAGGVAAAIEALRRCGFFDRKPRLPLCIEARTADEAREALRHQPDIIMLDNMSPRDIRATVRALARDADAQRHPLPLIEVSGNLTLKTIARYRHLPIDRISIGALTHSAPAVDISLRIESAR